MKKLACLILSLLMLICTIGCNSKSIEMTLNDGILENDYFSIDVTGYDDIRIGEEETGKPGVIAYCIVPVQAGTPWYNYIKIECGESKSSSFPTKDYFEMAANNPDHPDVVSGEVVKYETTENGFFVETEYQMTDGYTGYHRREGHWIEESSTSYAFYFYDYANSGKDEIYTNAIDSLTWK